ncbi:hypothetical protein F5Y15DRAFT_376762 [Xylariaceae sp. FL0016]|nr:hypothetical protein F5Y15DRAFT_376762 [Xylariaceae sp. FL0016]
MHINVPMLSCRRVKHSHLLPFDPFRWIQGFLGTSHWRTPKKIYGMQALVWALAIMRASAILPPITGNDFDFSVIYPSSLEISTSDPPQDVLPYEEIVFEEPQVTLSDADAEGRYLSFVEISYVPYIDGINDVIYTFPWVRTNLTVLENGTLSDAGDDAYVSYHQDVSTTAELRNATLHVWRQTDDMSRFLTEDEMPVYWQLATIWANITDDISYDFPRANIDFKVRNATGSSCRADVDGNGASIEGAPKTTTACAATATTVATTSATATDISGATTTAAGGTEGDANKLNAGVSTASGPMPLLAMAASFLSVFAASLIL